MAALPLETIEDTIDWLWDTPGAIRCCALVNSALLHRARVHIFHTVTLDAPELYERFSELIISSPTLGNHVRRLVLGDIIDPTIRNILGKLPCLQFLLVSGSRYWTYNTQDVRATVISAFQLPSLSSVAFMHWIGHSQEHALEQCPKLEHLSLFLDGSRKILALPQDTPPIRLKSLRLHISLTAPLSVFPSTAGENLLDLTGLMHLELDTNTGHHESSRFWFQVLNPLGAGWNSLTTLSWFPTFIDLFDFREFGSQISVHSLIYIL